MYGVYNAETLEKLVKTANAFHSQQSLVEDLFTGQKIAVYEIYSKMQNAHSIQHYVMNALLYLHTIKEKYIAVYNEFITQLHIYAQAIRVLAKGYLPISLITPYKLQESINFIKETLIKSNPDYDIVIERLHLCYDMKLVTFRIDQERNLIIQFPIFVQLYTQQPLILYQLETVPVPVIDQKPNAQSYIELKIKETIPCFKFRNIYKHSTARISNLQKDRIWILLWRTFHGKTQNYTQLQKCNILIWTQKLLNKICNFLFYYNKSDITPTVLDSGSEIILTNWPTNKHIICSINNDILIEIPSHPYVLANRSVLCNCRIEAENNYLLESLAACHNSNSKLIMYFTINNAFTNYLNDFNLTEGIEIPIFTNKSTLEITLPVFQNRTKFDESLLSAPLTLEEYMAQYKQVKEFFDLKERHDIDELEKEFANKNFFNSQVVKIFKFVVAIIMIIVTVVTIYAICKYNKLTALVTSLALQQVKEVKMEGTEDVDYKCKCTAQFYIILTLSIAMIV